MTDTREARAADLRERVIAAIGASLYGPLWERAGYRIKAVTAADAALALVVEECARAADDLEAENRLEGRHSVAEGAHEVATALRALTGEKQ